jgi:hypothetical protein
MPASLPVARVVTTALGRVYRETTTLYFHAVPCLARCTKSIRHDSGDNQTAPLTDVAGTSVPSWLVCLQTIPFHPLKVLSS